VPLGARIPTKNPKPWEFDDSLPEPDEQTWSKISITVQRTDGGIIDAELLRPNSWIQANRVVAGQALPMHIEELQVDGVATITAIDACPALSSGEGSAVTGRFVTRRVDEIARIEVLGADGQIETIEGTTIHPIWSLDRNDWVPLGELQEGERLLSGLPRPASATSGIGFEGIVGEGQTAIVITLSILHRSTPVYNIEVHGQHVYQVGELGLLVHNTCVIQPGTQAWADAMSAIANAAKGQKLNFTVKTATDAKQLLFGALGNMNRYKNYAHDVLHYSKGYEMHNVMNARELTVHSLQHLKWYANKTSGHIFYKFPN
ncbi:MAG: hypothetical protein KDB22_27055, partial [Planctomycetales bacterium]|nr:hypothetical protein [Planctomycetales bacterium]